MKLCETQEDYLLEVLDEGAKDASKHAEETMRIVKNAAGILRRNV